MNREALYFDNNATTKVDDTVYEAMRPFLTERYGNPSSIHSFGGMVMRDIDIARTNVAALINAQPREIIFTGSGSESDNHAIRGCLRAQPHKRHLIISAVEHPAVLNTATALEGEGYAVSYIGVNKDGALNIAELEGAIRSDTALISIMYANNETGVIFPIDKVGEIARFRGIPFHTDAVQAAGKLPIDVKQSPIDMLSLSGHKLHAPKGVGALYLRSGTPIAPFITGGHQEYGLRAGTENTASIAALGKAAEIAKANLNDEERRLREMRDELETRIMARIPHTRINGGGSERLPNTINFGFRFIEGEAILLMLEQFGVCASSGSACTTGSLDTSHVLKAMSVPPDYINGSLRLSLSKYNTMEEVDAVCAALEKTVSRLRELSPFNETNPGI